MKKKIQAFFFICLIFFISNINFVNAAINEKYGETTLEVNYDDMSSNSVLLNWIAEILYNFASAVESIGSGIIKMITGTSEFPWIDKVIFNTVPILDVNFINPASGSLFEDSNGNMTGVGNVIRNVYFTLLSIALGFIVIVIAVIAIKLAISSIASEQAKYKEAVVNWAMCLVLLFGLHFLISFLFFLNEKMVEVASSFMLGVLNDSAADSVIQLSESSDADNEKIVDNFINQANDKCFIADIPIIGTVWNAITDILNAIGRAIDAAWSYITGNEDAEDVINKDQLGKMYPNKDDYIAYFNDANHPERKDVAAYLLKDYFYRNTYLNWVSGTDTNSFNNSGLAGVGRNILVTINDVVGIADTGYKALRSLYTSVVMVCYNPNGEGNNNLYDTTIQESYNKLSDEEKAKFDEEIQKEGNNPNLKTENSVDNSLYYATFIKSTQDYIDYVDNLNREITTNETIASDSSKSDDERKNAEAVLVSLKLDRLYVQAYYRYIYDGEDKVEPSLENFISELGTYFKKASWYIDLPAGEWAPTSINVIPAILYAVLIIQSLLIFIAYLKRFFYVIILAMFGPIVVIFDFIKKSV